MAKEGKPDDSLTETLEEKMHDVKADAKKEAGVLDSFKSGVESVKGAFSAVTGGVGKAWSTLGEWKEEGVYVLHVCVVGSRLPLTREKAPEGSLYPASQIVVL